MERPMERTEDIPPRRTPMQVARIAASYTFLGIDALLITSASGLQWYRVTHALPPEPYLDGSGVTIVTIVTAAAVTMLGPNIVAVISSCSRGVQGLVSAWRNRHVDSAPPISGTTPPSRPTGDSVPSSISGHEAPILALDPQPSIADELPSDTRVLEPRQNSAKD